MNYARRTPMGHMLRRSSVLLSSYSIQLLLVAGIAMLGLGLSGVATAQETFSEAAFNDTLVRNAVGNLFRLIEGAFGALIMIIAGLIAIISAAMGAYRASLGMLVVALGAFILRALVSLFFGEDFEAFETA